MLQKNIEKIRQPAVAGQFYPSDKTLLSATISKYLKDAMATSVDNIKAIMVPHAGYDYSGPVAAYAYKQLQGKQYTIVVLIGNSHHDYFDGVTIDASDGWQTPLGRVKVDQDLAGKLAVVNKRIKIDSAAHAPEHSLEVQIPFLQTVLKPGFKIVPILFGNTTDDFYKDLAKILRENLTADDLVVISSDMSHYPNYADANRIDPATLEKVKALDVAALDKYVQTTESQTKNEDTLLCGIDAVKTVMGFAKLAGWQAEILHYANSGDTPLIGDKSRVVGYGAMAFGQDYKLKGRSEKLEISKELNKDQKKILLDIAQQTVASFVNENKMPEFDITDERLNWQEGAFVTLNKNGQLRGCIGQIVPTNDPLWQVVRDMAIAAATQDPRFSPVKKDELNNIKYEVSVLSAPAPIKDWHKIELGQDGVIVKKGWQTGIFLPQVATETGWDLETFLAELCSQKAGLPANAYKNDPDIKLEVFTAQVINQNGI